jgi:hypothetical protein
MKEKIDLTADKKIGPDGKPVGYIEQDHDPVEFVVNDIQDFNLPLVIENVAIKIAINLGRIIDRG